MNTKHPSERKTRRDPRKGTECASPWQPCSPLIAGARAWSWPRVEAATTTAAAAGRQLRRTPARRQEGRHADRSWRSATSTASTRATGTTRPTTVALASRPSARCTPGSPTRRKPTPDLATALPQVSDGGKTLTIKIKAGIKYSPPLSEPRPSRPRTSSTRSSAASCRRSPTATRASTTATSWASKDVRRTARRRRSRASQTPDDTTLVIKLDEARRACSRPATRSRCPCTVAGPEGLRPEVRQGQGVDLRRAPGVHRAVHGPERRARAS